MCVLLLVKQRGGRDKVSMYVPRRRRPRTTGTCHSRLRTTVRRPPQPDRNPKMTCLGTAGRAGLTLVPGSGIANGEKRWEAAGYRRRTRSSQSMSSKMRRERRRQCLHNGRSIRHGRTRVLERTRKPPSMPCPAAPSLPLPLISLARITHLANRRLRSTARRLPLHREQEEGMTNNSSRRSLVGPGPVA